MARYMMLVFAVLSVAPFFVAGQFIGYTGPCGESRGGVLIGELPTLAHGVSGRLWLEHAGRFCIENFNYDGLGPDAFLYFYYPGDEVREDGGGYTVRLNDQRAQFAVNVQFQDATFRFALPETAPVACDFGNFSIWCRYASQLFTKLEIPSDIFGATTVNRTSIACSPSPGRAFMGVLPTLFHEVTGQLFVKDNKTIIIRGFNYDGQGPDAFVYWYPVGMVADELGNGQIIPLGDPNVREGAFAVGTRYTDALLEISIPDNMDVYTCDIGTFTIWCRQFTQWFTRLDFNTDLFTNSLRVSDYDPSRIYCDRPATRPGVYTAELSTDTAMNEVSGAVYVVDEYQLYIQLFNYRPAGCTNAQLYFYTDGQEIQGSGGGYTISFSQSQESLPRSFTNEDITVDLRYSSINARTCDIKYLTVWCQSSQMHLSRIEIPDNTFTDDIRDTSKIFCEKRLDTGGVPPTVAVSGQLDLESQTYENCESLHEQIKLAWTVNQNNSTVSFLLCGCRQEDLTEQYVNQYVAFGLSGAPDGVRMQGGDVTVAWIDAVSGVANAVDYYLESYSQCREGRGVCPDIQHSSAQCTNDIIPGSVRGSSEDGIQCIAFEKPFTTADSTCDLTINPDTSQYVLWAIGGIEETAFKHFIRTETNDAPLNLGRAPSNRCGATDFVCPICHSFTEKVFDVREQNAVFVASIGPTGGARGYASIAGRAGWGYSWIINDTLIPHLIVSRGYTYTFISEGGDDPSNPGQYHPFYLTSSVIGGRLKNNEAQKEEETVYAGFTEDGTPVGLGPYCEYRQTQAALTALNNCGTFQEYLDGLSRDTCPTTSIANITRMASFTWTPDETTPNTVYYQCATHRGFGYKITVDSSLHLLPSTAIQLALAFISVITALMM